MNQATFTEVFETYARWGQRVLLALGATLAAASPARADQLTVEQGDGEAGYIAVEELAYETIITASPGHAATLRLRIALRNNSETPRDVVHTLALPVASKVTGIAIANDGVWSTGQSTTVGPPARRDPHTAFVSEISAASTADLPGAEVIVFGIAPGATVQVEVSTRIYPRLRSGRWELDLPARGVGSRVLAGGRRVLVQGLRKHENFRIDGHDNGRAPYIVTRAEDVVTVAWPSHLRSRNNLEAELELTPNATAVDGGSFQLYLRMGQAPTLRPSHVIALIDRSRSTPDNMDRGTLAMLGHLFDALPAATTFDALGFSRTTTSLLPAGLKTAGVHDKKARSALASALSSGGRAQGTDLANALAEAARLARRTRGRTLIVVATDGMFPSQTSPEAIAARFRAGIRGGRRPDILFVIDEPILEQRGLGPSHPVARVAAALGARISLRSLGTVNAQAAVDLLNAPSVLGKLKMTLPRGVVLDDPLPEGLVAGSLAMVRGHYEGTPPQSLKLHGELGRTKLRQKVPAVMLPPQAAAWVAVKGAIDLQNAVTEGLARPPWFDQRQAVEARRAITRASRVRGPRRGYLDRKIFRHYLTTRVLPRARVCYNHALTRESKQHGRVLLEMEVGKGEVMLARATQTDLKQTDTKLVACLTEAAWALDIPAAKMDQQIYHLRYPLRLVAPNKPNGAGTVVQISDEVMEVLLALPTPTPR